MQELVNQNAGVGQGNTLTTQRLVWTIHSEVSRGKISVRKGSQRTVMDLRQN